MAQLEVAEKCPASHEDARWQALISFETQTSVIIGQPSAAGTAAADAARRLKKETERRSRDGWRMVGQCSPGEGVIACSWERKLRAAEVSVEGTAAK